MKVLRFIRLQILSGKKLQFSSSFKPSKFSIVKLFKFLSFQILSGNFTISGKEIISKYFKFCKFQIFSDISSKSSNINKTKFSKFSNLKIFSGIFSNSSSLNSNFLRFLYISSEKSIYSIISSSLIFKYVTIHVFIS
jgi:hypothetical protein